MIGGGYVGAELAQMFSRAGVKVTLVCRSRLLPEAEPEIGSALTGYFADEGIVVVSGVSYRSIRKTESGVALDVARDGRDMTVEADEVLIATGRTPNIEGLGLAEFGVALSPKGAIVVDDRMRTTRAGVYAAGDVTGRDQFVYMAAYGAKLAAKNALNGDSLRYDKPRCRPSCSPTRRSRASASPKRRRAPPGTSPTSRRSARLCAARARRARHARAHQARGRGRERKLLGAHILAPEGADSIQTAALAIAAGSRSTNSRRRSSLPHDRRGPETGGSRLQQGRGEALLLRRVGTRLATKGGRWRRMRMLPGFEPFGRSFRHPS